METNHNNQSVNDLETLMFNLQTEDERNLKMVHKMQNTMWVMVALYILLFIQFFYLKAPWYKSFGAFLTMLAFIVYGLRYRNHFKKMKSVDYGLPTTEMLVNAAHRYRFQIFRGDAISELIPLILIDLGLCFMLYSNPIFGVMFIQGFFVLTFVVLIPFGYLKWKKHHKPLRDHALALLKEIES
jgi:hypothetical protein